MLRRGTRSAHRRPDRTAVGRGSRRATGPPHGPRPTRRTRRPTRRRAVPGPSAFEKVCRGCSPKRRTCGSSARSGVAPLTWEIQGPSGVSAATSSIARSGTQRRTSSGVGCVVRDASLGEPRAHRRADAPARAHDPDSFDHSSAPVPARDTGQRKCALRPYLSASRASRCSRTVGHSASVTLYHALSRFSPPRTSMWLRWTPSNVAPSASSARQRALVLRVGLPLDATAAPDVERVPQLEVLRVDVDPAAPHRRMQPRPPDLDGAVLGSECEEAGRADDLAVAHGHERKFGSGGRRVQRLPDEGSPFLPRLRLDDAEPAPGPRVARGEPERPPRARAAAARAARCGRRASVRSTAPPRRDVTLGACRSTSTRAWSASRTSTSSSARATRP